MSAGPFGLRLAADHLLIRAGRWVAGPEERVVEPRSRAGVVVLSRRRAAAPEPLRRRDRRS